MKLYDNAIFHEEETSNRYITRDGYIYLVLSISDNGEVTHMEDGVPYGDTDHPSLRVYSILTTVTLPCVASVRESYIEKVISKLNLAEKRYMYELLRSEVVYIKILEE